MEENMQLSLQEFLTKTGLEEDLAPGEVKLKKHPSDKEGNSYTVVYDRKTDPQKVRVEVRPGLSGLMPMPQDMSKYAVWLQTQNFVEFEIGNA